MVSLLENIGERKGDMSINRLEAEAGLTRGSMAKWDNHCPAADKLYKVAQILGCTMEELLVGAKKSPPASREREELIKLFDSAPPTLQQAALAVLESTTAQPTNPRSDRED